MSVKLTNMVRSSRGFGLTEKFVLQVMASYGDDKGGRIFPSVGRLAADCAMSDRTVQKAVGKLLDRGVLVRIRHGGGTGVTNLYRIDIDALEAFIPTVGSEDRLSGEDQNGRSRVNVVHPLNNTMGEPPSGLRVKETTPKGEGRSPNPLRHVNTSIKDAREGNEKQCAFQGRAIRLTVSDFENWRTIYHGIPDLRAELVGLDAWWNEQRPVGDPKRGKWFNAIAGALNKKHQKAIADKKAGRGLPTRRQPAVEVL